MNFQIKKLILWPKNNNFEYKAIDFDTGKINIITGASRTGKSAIIPIIDYCLASGECYIPVKTIRNACSWFGIVVQTDNGQILLARREPGIQKSTDDMFVIESKQVSIPKMPVKNTTAKSVRQYLDQLASLSFLDIDSETDNQYYSRPSFRDLMAFCFQPQNIVANANTLFYKADTSEHRTKLINIFPYIIGAVTPDVLAKRQEISRLEKELMRKERDLSKIKDVAEKWKTEINGWLSVATEFGLIDKNAVDDEMSFEQQVEILSSLAAKKASDSNVLKKNIQESSQEIVALRKEESEISLRLSTYKNRYTEMTQLMKSVDDYRQSLSIQVERLNISKWLKSLAEGENICPICGKSDELPQNQLEKFYKSLELLEEEAGYTDRIPAAFEREYENVKTEIEKITEQLVAVQKRIKIQSHILNSSEEEKYTTENIARFLGQVQYASETFEQIGDDSHLTKAIQELNQRLRVLRSQVDENAIRKKLMQLCDQLKCMQ